MKIIILTALVTLALLLGAGCTHLVRVLSGNTDSKWHYIHRDREPPWGVCDTGGELMAGALAPETIDGIECGHPPEAP